MNIEQAKQVAQRLREYRNYKTICTQAADTIDTLIAELAECKAAMRLAKDALKLPIFKTEAMLAQRDAAITALQDKLEN